MKFLSDDWFDKLDELRAAAGDLAVPAALAGLVVNIHVEGDGESRQVHLDGGNFQRGSSSSASATLTLSSDLARKIFLDGDLDAGMHAFMAGEIKIDGDMSKLLVLQTTPLSDKQKALQAQLKEVTD